MSKDCILRLQVEKSIRKTVYTVCFNKLFPGTMVCQFFFDRFG